MTKSLLLMILFPVCFSGCAELHQRGGRFTATAVSANIFFLQIPGNPMELANEKVPPGAEVTNVNGSPNELTSVPGVLSRILGFGWAQIGGMIRSGYGARTEPRPASRAPAPQRKPVLRQPSPYPRAKPSRPAVPRRRRTPGDYIK